MTMTHSNQRVANLHHVLDELADLLTAIQDNFLIQPHRNKEEMIESYQSQRMLFFDMVAIVLPALPTQTPQTPVIIRPKPTNKKQKVTEPVSKTFLNPESNEFVPSISQHKIQNQSMPS